MRDVTVAFGKSFDKVDALKWRGLLIPYGSESNRDLHGEWFSARTDTFPEQYALKGLPVMYNHGLSDFYGTVKIGAFTDTWQDDDGQWVELELSDYDEYLRLIESYNKRQNRTPSKAEMQRRAKSMVDRMAAILSVETIGLSSGAHPQSVRVNDETGEILQWHPIEGSITATPAMPTATRITPLKSLQPLLESALGRYRADDGEMGFALSIQPTITSKGKITMPTKVKDASAMLAALRDELLEIQEVIAEEVAERGTMGDEDKGAMYDKEALRAMIEEIIEAKFAKMNEDDKAKMETDEEAKSWFAANASDIVSTATAKAVGQAMQAQAATQDRRAALRTAARDGITAAAKAAPAKGKLQSAIETGHPVKGVGNTGQAGEFIKSLVHHTTGQGTPRYTMKDYNPNVGPQGGFVMNEILMQELVEPLRANLVLERAGITTTSVNQVAQISRARMLTAPSTFFPAINTDITNTSATFGVISTTMHPIGSYASLPYQMLYGTAIDIQTAIVNQALRSMLESIERVGLLGLGAVTGTNTGAEPRGLILEAPSENLDTNGRVPKFTDLVTIDTAVATANANTEGDTYAYLVAPREFGTFRSLTDSTNRPLFTDTYGQASPATIMGRRVFQTSYLPTNLTVGTGTDCGRIIGGEFRYLEKVMFSGMETVVDPYSSVRSLLVNINIFAYFGYLVHQPDAFYVLNGARPVDGA